MVENLNAPSHLDAETVLREIEVQQGILVERARDAYSFSHLTFQEYLTAKCIVDNQKIDRLVRDHVTERHWREVFLLVAGLASGRRGADDLLGAMERQAQTYLTSDKLKAMIAWATLATKNSPSNAKAPAKRVAAIFLVRDLARDLVLALALSLAHARDLALSLALDRALDLAKEGEVDLDRALDLALDLDLDLALVLAKEYQRLGIFSIDSINSLTI